MSVPSPAPARPPALLLAFPEIRGARRAACSSVDGCIENRLTVDLFTQIHADGTCTRRVEYRLERVDTREGRRARRHPPEGRPAPGTASRPASPGRSARRRTDRPARGRGRGAAPVAGRVRGRLPPGAHAARPARAQRRLGVRRPRARDVYEYQEVLPRPGLAARRARASLAARAQAPTTTSPRRFAAALPARAPLRASRTCGGSSATASPSPSRGRSRPSPSGPLRAARAAATSSDLRSASTRSRRTSPRASSRSRRAPRPRRSRPPSRRLNALGEALLAELDEAGLPFLRRRARRRVRFRATLVMPAPILRANACVTGDTAVWEFEEERPLRPRLRDEGARRRALTL